MYTATTMLLLCSIFFSILFFFLFSFSLLLLCLHSAYLTSVNIHMWLFALINERPPHFQNVTSSRLPHIWCWLVWKNGSRTYCVVSVHVVVSYARLHRIPIFLPNTDFQRICAPNQKQHNSMLNCVYLAIRISLPRFWRVLDVFVCAC